MAVITKEKIRNFFYDRCTDKEIDEVDEWFAENADMTETDKLLVELLNEIDINNLELATSGFEKVCRRLGINPQPKKSKRIRFVLWMQRIAAVLILPLFVSAFYYYNQSQNPKEWVEVYASYGENKQLILPDNSTITLNSGSKLIYPAKFNSQLRQIYISGEAYAEIAEEKERPFILSARDVNIRVLGTKFNMKAYDEDSEVEVMLIEGSVSMTTVFDKKEKCTVLKPGESVKFDRSTGRISNHNFLPEYYKDWKSSKVICFTNQKLSDISAQLERTFKVTIIVEDKSLLDVRYYASFVNNENVDEILNVINADKAMKIKRKDDNIYISKQ